MKSTIIAIIIAVALIGGAIAYTQAPAAVILTAENNVAVEDGTQIIDISAKGGYVPKASAAKAGIPTVLRLTTKGTFDCSSAVRIPSLGISKNLPPSGTTEIDLGTPQKGTLRGMCSMGMYSFTIEFRT